MKFSVWSANRPLLLRCLGSIVLWAAYALAGNWASRDGNCALIVPTIYYVFLQQQMYSTLGKCPKVSQKRSCERVPMNGYYGLWYTPSLMLCFFYDRWSSWTVPHYLQHLPAHNYYYYLVKCLMVLLVPCRILLYFLCSIMMHDPI